MEVVFFYHKEDTYDRPVVSKVVHQVVESLYMALPPFLTTKEQHKKGLRTSLCAVNTCTIFAVGS